MKKSYVIVPVILALLFGFYYANFNSKYEAALAAEQADKERKEKEAADAKKAAEVRAAAEAQAKLEASRKEERERTEKRRVEQEKVDRELFATNDRLSGEVATLTKEIEQMQSKLTQVRDTRQKTADQAFELAKQVELARIERRNAENDIQRNTQMIADRIGASSMVEMPFFAQPGGKEKGK